MAKTLIDVDEQYLAAAQEALHTETTPVQWIVPRGTVP
jgi:hypothetical protein